MALAPAAVNFENLAIPTTWVALAPHDVTHGVWRLIKLASNSKDSDAAGSIDGQLQALTRRLPRSAVIVVIAPLTRCIVMSVDLPLLQGVKLQQALAGVLGDRLLGIGGTQHLAAAPSINGRIPEAAACDAVWFKQCLDSVDAAGLRISHIVPEAILLPKTTAWWGQLHAEQSPAWLIRAENGEAAQVGPTLLDAMLPSAQDNQQTVMRFFVDPACNKPPALNTFTYSAMSAAALLRSAANTTWDLRQFAFAPPDGAARLMTWMGGIARKRSGRFALGTLLALLAINVLGLNLYALKQQHQINALHAEMERIVNQALPGQPRLLEPALQLETAWRRARGATVPTGTSTLLGFLALTGNTQALTVLEVSDRTLHATFADNAALDRSSATCLSTAMRDALLRAGVRCTREGTRMLLEFVPETASSTVKG